ncbi:N-acetylglucosaminyl transferase component [Sesbania bispinosa]|nr:N-acetylglucosaminyl transferase component [Sesbania bispinosa]
MNLDLLPLSSQLIKPSEESTAGNCTHILDDQYEKNQNLRERKELECRGWEGRGCKRRTRVAVVTDLLAAARLGTGENELQHRGSAGGEVVVRGG